MAMMRLISDDFIISKSTKIDMRMTNNNENYQTSNYIKMSYLIYLIHVTKHSLAFLCVLGFKIKPYMAASIAPINMLHLPNRYLSERFAP